MLAILCNLNLKISQIQLSSLNFYLKYQDKCKSVSIFILFVTISNLFFALSCTKVPTLPILYITWSQCTIKSYHKLYLLILLIFCAYFPKISLKVFYKIINPICSVLILLFWLSAEPIVICCQWHWPIIFINLMKNKNNDINKVGIHQK